MQDGSCQLVSFERCGCAFHRLETERRVGPAGSRHGRCPPLAAAAAETCTHAAPALRGRCTACLMRPRLSPHASGPCAAAVYALSPPCRWSVSSRGCGPTQGSCRRRRWGWGRGGRSKRPAPSALRSPPRCPCCCSLSAALGLLRHSLLPSRPRGASSAVPCAPAPQYCLLLLQLHHSQHLPAPVVALHLLCPHPPTHSPHPTPPPFCTAPASPAGRPGRV